MNSSNCSRCQNQFVVDDAEEKFIDAVSPEIAGKKFNIPLPSLCPDCREQERLVWRNDRHIYRRKSDKTGNDIVSIYAPNNTDFKVFENELWTKDDWDPMSYGKDYDESKSFFEQFGNLLRAVPRQATNTTMNENSEYSNQTWKSKGLYLCFNVGPAEDCCYCSEAWWVKNCIDCFYAKNCEFCYSCFNIHESSNCFWSEQLNNCSNAYFSFDCIGCHDVFLCSNLRNKNYCIENKEYSKEEYLEKLASFEINKRSNVDELRNKFAQLKLSAIRKENNNQKTEDCTGDYLVECKDCSNCYYSHTSINCHRVINVDNDAKDCRDCDFITDAQYCYYSTSVAGQRNNFCVWIAYGSDNLYSNFCDYCDNCLGCVGLKHKKYCILNKQYSKEEYERVATEIIEKMQHDGEWGKFMPMQYSYFFYNDTVANLYFPLNKEDTEKLGAKWQDQDFSLKIDNDAYLPDDDILSYKDENKRKELLASVIKCSKSGKAFKIMPQELAFYIQHNIPVPTVHSEERYMELFRCRNPRRLYERQCDCDEEAHGHTGRCETRFKTTYAPERSEKVYCESCYQKAVI